MSSDTVISVRNIGKTFRIASTQHRATTLAELVAQKLRKPFTRHSRETEFEALHDVSFEVDRGEVLGIIGRNGAGKSTLLKILSQITPPTRGEIDLHGRVGALLEVGTGFHPELTGRENIYLNGAILGMNRREIDREFDSIVAFAETEQFLDVPVKRYSSGMYVRLAFSVAAHLRPDILIVDEVLAVGDLAFQRKCLGKMGEIAREEGRAVLLVSHNAAAVRALCERAILLDRGRVVHDGEVNDVLRSYLDIEPSGAAVLTWTETNAPREGGFRYRSVAVLNSRGEPASVLSHDEPFTIRLEYELDRPLPGLRVGFLMQTTEGVEVCGSNDVHVADEETRQPGRKFSECRFPAHLLNEGRYQLRFGADVPHGPVYILTPYCLEFSVEDHERHGESRYRLPGVLRPALHWAIDSTSPAIG
ncbi:ABC transporter-related protein [Chthoniobacter flavus Ellin428]|uniref:ABC transporter-related protein n=1 Tax=Chthoniobacter flavus Ellin428 TaxID=497964 RepID=B4D1J0_9BACT|nr:ABC transporter ATP-binding protein [Chthoniobacter flavus]EDY19602.1 ABC transporter-related protein [Chthoniobacter flavus Ellin428]TCO92842.1 lipopolysaccharide transport system ATP-binding protein [Chthoniobacter flavus]